MITNETPDSIVFEPFFQDDRYRLVQVTKELAEHVRNGKTFVIRARMEDSCCFCTDSTTYRVREVDTTDTMFISDVNTVKQAGAGEEYKIRGNLQHFLELTKDESSPYLALKTLLEKHEFDLSMTEANNDNLITMDDVLNVIQFSEGEIRAALKRLPVVEYKGALRYLKRSLREEMLGKLVDIVDDVTIEGITLKEVDRTVMSDCFNEEYPEVFIDWLFSTYVNADGTLSTLAVCRDRAIESLAKEPSMGITAFERKMSQRLPIDMEFDMAALRGVAIIKNTVTRGQVIEYLNVDTLPSTPKERLAALFKIKPSWSAENIEPYVIDFCTSKAAVGTFLLKNCQSVKEGNEKVFVQKDNDF